jgi:TonB family protein
VAVAQEPLRVIQPGNDAGATGEASSKSPIASDTTGNVSAAKPLTLPIPIYPPVAVKHRIMGIVKVAVEIDSAGKITSAHALDGPMILRRSALDAAYNAHFSPAQIGDKPAKANGVIRYIFRLADHKTEEVSAATVKPIPAASVADGPPRQNTESSERDAAILKGDLKEKVNAVTVPPPTNLIANKPAGESTETKAPNEVNFQGAATAKVSAVPAKHDPAASLTDKPATERRESKAPDAVNPKVERNTNAGTTVAQPLVTAPSLTATYRVGVGDILDVRILGDTSKKSTLVSVLEGGVLDFHQAGDPLVGGMTLEEIRVLLTTELKRRSSGPETKLAVGVRDYASHMVTVSGLVALPGNKIMRREAVPLYVALAEAQPRPDADRVQISCRATGQITLVSLSDPLAMETLVHPGDVINVSPRPSEFYYIAGFVNVPGQKSLPLGITLMQAIMSAGGVSRTSVSRVEIGRQRPDGFVSFEKYSLKEIKAGKMKDPALRAGDRIEVLKP